MFFENRKWFWIGTVFRTVKFFNWIEISTCSFASFQQTNFFELIFAFLVIYNGLVAWCQLFWVFKMASNQIGTVTLVTKLSLWLDNGDSLKMLASELSFWWLFSCQKISHQHSRFSTTATNIVIRTKFRWQWYWRHRYVGDFMMVTDLRCWWQNTFFQCI